MKMNKDVQNAVLLCLYLARSGRTTVESAAEGLGITVPFLQRVAHKLKKADIILSFKGPHGGYELNADPQVGSIMEAISLQSTFTASEMKALRFGVVEKRALGLFGHAINTETYKVMSMTVRDLIQTVINQEVDLLNKTHSELNQ